MTTTERVPNPRLGLLPLRRVRPARGTCRVLLVINGIEYNARPIPTQEPSVRKLFRLRKPDGAAYHVSHHDYGSECDCPDFVFHRDGIDPAGCKHIQALAACGIIPAPEGTPLASNLDQDELPFGPGAPLGVTEMTA